MNSINRALASLAPVGLLITRVLLGVLFLLHGLDKFDTGISNVEDFFSQNDVPLAALSAPLVAVVEVVLGIALIAGIGTRIAAIVLAVVMVGAIIFVKGSTVLGGNELDLAYLSGLAALIVMGPGPLSADRVLNLESRSPALA